MIDKTRREEKPEGFELLMNLFQQIYCENNSVYMSDNVCVRGYKYGGQLMDQAVSQDPFLVDSP